LFLRVNAAARRWLGLNLGRVLFRRVHDAVGRSMRILVTGGSRFDPRIGRDLFDMGFNIIQAYGLTECAGACTATRPGDPCIESVGPPLDGIEIRIAREADGAADREYPDGEVLVRGPILMQGYFNRPDATAAALRDGWLYTGDLGYLDDKGRLFITGRKKEMIVLASGKNIYPEEIEAVYLKSPFIKEICVLGVSNPDEPSAERLHAIVVPDLDALRERRVVNMREVIRFDIEGLALQLPHHKRVLSFDISQEELPRTTTRKLKRHAIEKAYYQRAAVALAEPPAAEVTPDDRTWLDDPLVARVLPYVRAAAKPGRTVTPGANLELDLGLDSMERVELMAALEQAFGVDIQDDDAHHIFTVRDLVDNVRAGAQRGATAGESVDPWAHLLDADDADAGELAYLLRPRPLYTPLAFVLLKAWSGVMRLCWGLRVTGRPHVAAPGGFLISPNHQSYLDAFVLVATLPYRTFSRTFFVGAAEYFSTPAKRAFARLINLVPVDPDAHLVHAMQAGAFGLRHGKVLVLFPEGERSPDGSVRTFKKGAAILASHLRVPIVPVALHGIYELWPRGGAFRWSSLLPVSGARARVAYGPAIPPPAGEAGTPPTGDTYTAHTSTLREAVLAMWKSLDSAR
jgi:long-chain acyl-CoA synthetase